MRLRWTVSLRLALTTAVSFFVAGAVLLALNHALVRRSLPGEQKVVRPLDGAPAECPGPSCPDVHVQISAAVADATSDLRQQTLDELAVQSLWTLAAATVLAAGLGWLIARRAVRPVRVISAAARSISENDLHSRLDARGPHDELKELADTFDAMLARLDVAFSAQRRFAAAASHELRTPVAVQRTLLDVALADPDADEAALRQMAERLRTLALRQERLIEGLLQLAVTDGAVDLDEPVDLSAAAAEALEALAAETTGLDVRASLAPAPTVGNAVLLTRVVGNLVENAVRHNAPGGTVEVRTCLRAGRAVMLVENDGADLTAADLRELEEPFRRGGASRTGSGAGAGLGLAVARAVVERHGADLALQARPAGGLRAELSLPGRA